MRIELTGDLMESEFWRRVSGAIAERLTAEQLAAWTIRISARPAPWSGGASNVYGGADIGVDTRARLAAIITNPGEEWFIEGAGGKPQAVSAEELGQEWAEDLQSLIDEY